MLQLRHAGLKLFACDRRDRRLERASEPSPFPAFRIDGQKDDDCAAWIQRVLCVRPHDCPMHAAPFTIARVHAHRHIQREDDLHSVMRMYWKDGRRFGDGDPATLPKVCTRIPSDFLATACHSGKPLVLCRRVHWQTAGPTYDDCAPTCASPPSSSIAGPEPRYPERCLLSAPRRYFGRSRAILVASSFPSDRQAPYRGAGPHG